MTVILKIRSKNLKRLRFFLFLFFVFILFFYSYYAVNRYQHFRYDRKNYNCADMTRDCEFFFEVFLGLDCKRGFGINPDNRSVGHEWLVVDLFGFSLEWESTGLYFKDVSSNYVNVSFDEGYFKNT